MRDKKDEMVFEQDIKISISNLIKSILEYPNIRGIPDSELRVQLTPEDSYDGKDLHPIESFFIKKGISYYFKDNEVFQENHYDLDLRRLKIDYNA